MNPQAHVRARRGPREGHGSGRGAVSVVAHRRPVAHERLGAVRTDLHGTHLLRPGDATGNLSRHVDRRADLARVRVRSPGLGDVRARQGHRRARVGVQVRGVDAGGLEGILGDVPRRLTLGRGDVHMGVILLLVAQLRLEVEAGERGGQDEDARDVHAEGHAGHALAEVGALAASIRRTTVVHEGAVHAAAHDDATRHGNPAAFHADRGHLGSVLDELQ